MKKTAFVLLCLLAAALCVFAKDDNKKFKFQFGGSIYVKNDLCWCWLCNTPADAEIDAKLEYKAVINNKENNAENLKVLETMNNLTGIELPSDKNDFFKIICKLKNIKELKIENRDVSYDSLKIIGNMKNLEILNLPSAELCDNQLLMLSKLKKIKNIDFVWSQITDNGVDCITAFTNVESLNITNCSNVKLGLSKLKKLPKLKEIFFLSCDKMNESAYDGLADLKKLDSLLFMDYSNINNKIINNILKCKNYRLLSFWNCSGLNDSAFDNINCENLETLCIYGKNKISNSSLLYILKANKIKDIVIRNSDKLCGKNICISNIPSLESIDFSSSINLGGITIDNVNNLKSIDFSQCNLSDKDLSNVNFKNLNLKTISLSSNDITSETIKKLCEIQSLEELFLGFCPNIDDSCVEYLKMIKCLKIISLDGTSISDENKKELKKYLK